MTGVNTHMDEELVSRVKWLVSTDTAMPEAAKIFFSGLDMDAVDMVN